MSEESPRSGRRGSESERPSSASSSSKAARKNSRAEREAEEKVVVPMKPPPEPRMKGVHIVLPYLLVGGADVAVNKEELLYLGVKHIINCASEDVDNMFPEDFEYSSFDIEDTNDGEPEEYFDECYEAISKCKDSRKLAFVHCTLGKSIAPAMVLSYMMKSAKAQDKHLSLQQAFSFLGAKIPEMQIEDNYMDQLIDLEEELFEDTSMKRKKKKNTFSSSRVAGRGGRGGRGGKGKRGK